MNAPACSIPTSVAEWRSNLKPVWCPGCGDFSVLSSFAKAFLELKLDPNQTAMISGIGCSSRLPAYLTSYGYHSIHGRALAIGAGVKLARPDLTVVVTGGDGDGFSIGGNHFIHACRRNVDMTYVVMDNRVYGMTKGQPSPTTEADWDNSAMAPPGGTGVAPFNPLAIGLTAGASFVARTFSGDPNHTASVIAEAIRHPGFSVVLVLSPCVTFREEERLWKERVHKAANTQPITDQADAARMLMADDGFTLGVLYKNERPAWTPSQRAPVAVADLDAQFRTG